MLKSISKLRSILNARDVRRLMLLAIPIVVSAILEAISVLSILPFMRTAFSSDEQLGSDLPFLSLFENAERSELLLTFGSIVLMLFAASIFTRVLTEWLTQKTVWNCAHHISMDMVDQFARQPYEFFLNNNSSDLIKQTISDIQSLVSGILMVGCRFVQSSTKSVAVLLMLMFVDYQLTLMASLVFGGIYLAIHYFRHNYLEELGRTRQSAIATRIKTFTEIVSGIKTIRVAGKLPWFVNRFEKASRKFCQVNPTFQLYSLIPRSLVEFLAFGAIISFILIAILNGQDLNSFAPKLSIFALATYRLLPALGTAFSQAAIFSHNLPVIDDVVEDQRKIENLLQPLLEASELKPLDFESRIEVKNLSFTYDASSLPILSDINLNIGKSQKTALVGLTGCGKSTLLQLMVGLLTPSEGEIRVDSTKLSNEVAYSWHRSIAYMPQEVFLFDDTIAANIALGESLDQRDEKCLRQAIEIAQVDQFLDSEFREGINTMVGEHGVRLSGGQRQRIGLARAIYRHPKVLFLDEATSALDSITEDAVVAGINEAFPDMTIVMVAHRLSSTKFCDQIVLLEGGRISAAGTFDELAHANSQFRQMVELSE